MRIGIGCDVAVGERPTGIGLHVRNLAEALASILSPQEQEEYDFRFSQVAQTVRSRFGSSTNLTQERFRRIVLASMPYENEIDNRAFSRSDPDTEAKRSAAQNAINKNYLKITGAASLPMDSVLAHRYGLIQ